MAYVEGALGSRRIRYAKVFLAVLALTFLVAVLFPETAHAWILDDAVNAIHDLIKGMLASIANALYTKVFEIMKAISVASPLGSDWDNVFGGGTGNAILSFATDVCNGVVKPIGCGVLTFVALVQMINISQRMDSNGTLPALKEIVILFVSLAVFTWLVNNVDTILGGLYDLLNSITKAILDYNPDFSDKWGSIEFVAADASGSYASVEYGDLFAAILGGLFAFLVSGAAFVVALVLAYARGIQLYAMMTFAPLPISFLGIDETRHWGVNFIKNFLSVCLAGAIMVFVLLSFPYLTAAVVGSDATGSIVIDIVGAADSASGGSLSAVLTALKIIAVCLMLVIALIKSGGWARDILGG